MLFAAKVVEPNANGTMLIKVGVVALVFIVITLIVPSLGFLAPFFLLAVLLLVIITAIVTKGNLSSYKLENDLVVFDSEMQICHIVFPMDEVTGLKFEFKSFNGMIYPTYNTETDLANSRDYGLDNRISFRYKKQYFEYKFYVQSQQHFFNFVQILEKLYESHVPFEEQNWKGKTFMMQNVNELQYEKLIRKYSTF